MPIRLTRALRVAGRWWQYLTDPISRSRLQRIGLHLLPVISGGSPSVLSGYLRYRVVNPRAINFSDGFEQPGGGFDINESGNGIGGRFLWHSLGTELETDNSITYWDVISGSPTYSAHLLTPGANAGSDPTVVAGHDDWGDMTFTIRFKMDTGGSMKVFVHYVDTNNWIELRQQAGTLALDKRVAGVTTASIATATSTLTNATFYWAQITAASNTYTLRIFNDTGPGTLGTQVSTCSGTISDAGVQAGKIGIAGQTASFQFGGAFTGVCYVMGVMPEGWQPVVLAGEPAFAISKVSPQAGTYTASIQIRGSTAGSGYWRRRLTGMLAGNNTLSCQVKASAGNANTSVGLFPDAGFVTITPSSPMVGVIAAIVSLLPAAGQVISQVGGFGPVAIGANTTVSPTFAQPTIAGDCLVAFVEANGATTATTATGWVQNQETSFGQKIAIWSRLNCGANEAPPVFTSSGGSKPMQAQLGEFKNVATANAVEHTGGASTLASAISNSFGVTSGGNSASVVSWSIRHDTDAAPGNLVLFASSWDASGTATASFVETFNNNATAVHVGDTGGIVGEFQSSFCYCIVPTPPVTANAGTTYSNLSITGAMTMNPQINLNYSGGIGKAYFDSLLVAIDPAVAVITDDLPHLHQSSWEIRAMLPGNPGSNTLGSFKIPLHPPGSPEYDKARGVYEMLDYTQRVEGYLGYSAQGIGLGNLKYAGIVTEINIADTANPSFDIGGVSDLFWANYSRPFPGEAIQLNYGSGNNPPAADYRQAHHYFATDELGAVDDFTNFAAANYAVTAAGAGTAGIWNGGLDNLQGAVNGGSSGTGAVIISQTGLRAYSQYNRHLVEVSGRLLPSTDATNAGGAGVGLTYSPRDVQDSMIAWIRAKKNASTGHWDLDVLTNGYASGVLTQTVKSNALTNVDDPEGYIPFSIQLQASFAGVTVTVNGKLIFSTLVGGTPSTGGYDPGFISNFPLLYSPAGTGGSTAFFNSLVHMSRYSDDFQSGTAIFLPGNIGTPSFSLPIYTDPGPTFLEIWTRVATRESWYWRYTPTPYVVGVRTLGTIDMNFDPGTDNTKTILFDRARGNLIGLTINANADPIASGTSNSGTSGNDSGGIAYWRDIKTMLQYGVFSDQTLSVIAANFNELQLTSRKLAAFKVSLGSAGSKTATVLRDPATADRWRELDSVTINNPRTSINYLAARIVGYTFEEGSDSQTVTLDQFSHEDSKLLAKRTQQGLFQIANKFANR